MVENDASLIERTSAGDYAAFEELYKRYAPSVLGMARRQLADRGSAEEVTQEAFIAIWRSAPRFRPERGTGSAWIYTIARNTIVNRVRRQPAPAVNLLSEASPEPGPSERAESLWLTWRMQTALVQLPEQERVVLELAYWAGFSQAEIASYLDVPIGTVKTRTRAALKRLRALLYEVNE